MDAQLAVSTMPGGPGASAPRNKGGRPADASRSLEDMILREMQQQCKQNDRLRQLGGKIIANIETLITDKADDLGAQVSAAKAVVDLMESSANMIDTIAKHTQKLRDMEDARGPGGIPADLRKLLGGADGKK